ARAVGLRGAVCWSCGSAPRAGRQCAAIVTKLRPNLMPNRYQRCSKESLLVPGYPFLRQDWLRAFVSSGAVAPAGMGAGAGWQDLSVRDGSGEYLLPLYRKLHSWGEYVFDQTWARAYARHGLDYYPKLVTAVPYTPASGPRWTLPPGVTDAAGWLWPQVEAALSAQRASGWHL